MNGPALPLLAVLAGVLSFSSPCTLPLVPGYLGYMSGVSSSRGRTLGAAGLFVNNHIVFYHERRTILNMRDAQIEARYLSAALSGKPVSETAGFAVAESSIRLVGQDARLKEAFANLSEELKSLLDSPPDASGGIGA